MSTLIWSTDAKRAFALFATLNWPFGLWPLLEVDLRVKIRVFVGFIQLMCMAITTLYEVFQNCGNAEDSVDNLLVFASAVISLSKLISYHLYRGKLATNVKSAMRDWSMKESVDYRDVMTSYERIYKRVTFALLTAVVLSIICYSIKVIVIDPDEMIEVKESRFGATNVTEYVVKKRYLFPSTCTLNDVPKTLYFVLIFNQFVQMIVSFFVALGTDGFFLALTTHLCGQFEILRIKFANVGYNANLPIESIERRKLTGLIARHQHLLRLTVLLEDAYNKIVLTQLVASVTSISVAGFSFLIAMKTDYIFGSIKSLAVMQFMLMQSFMYTCIGEALQNQGDNVRQSVYNGPWYKLPPYLSKDLVFVMMRSNISPHLTAGKFFDMTRATFMDVVKISSSYLSILRIMLNE